MEQTFCTWNGLRVQCVATGERCRRPAPCELGKDHIGQGKGKSLYSRLTNPVLDLGDKIKKMFTNPSTRHSERCPECKIRVRELLERIYGTCLQNHKFSWSTHLSSYAGTAIFPALRKVATALEAYRGFSFEDFVRAKAVAPCDFWVPNPGFIVEFDESQHFTSPRKLTLSAYPDDHSVGFSRDRWIALCEKHNARDNDPPYRDE